MIIKALVVDDELPARQELVYLLKASGMVRVIGECEDGDEIMAFLQRVPADVVFLDIRMRSMDGLTAAWQIAQLPEPPQIVFTTAYSQYAQKAFDLNAVDYILKPYTQERVNQSIIKAAQALKTNSANRQFLTMLNRGEAFEPGRIVVWKNDRLLVVLLGDILYAQSTENRKTLLVTSTGEYQTSFTLRGLSEKLKPPQFLQTHRSYIVNLGKVQEITPWFNGTYLLRLTGAPNAKIPVSRHYIKEFNAAMGID